MLPSIVLSGDVVLVQGAGNVNQISQQLSEQLSPIIPDSAGARGLGQRG